MKRKPVVSKKRAAEGRPVKCRDCYVNMGRQLNINGGEDLLCPRCGRTWPVPNSTGTPPDAA